MLSIQDLNNENYKWMSEGNFGLDGCQRRKRCVKQLLSYIGTDANVSLLHLIDPVFMARFGEYLYRTRGKDKSLDIIEDWLDVCQRMLRDGIRNGYLPNCDPMTEIRRRFAEEYGSSSDRDKGDNRNAPNHDFSTELARVVSLISSSTAMLRQSTDAQFAAAGGVDDCKWWGGGRTY